MTTERPAQLAREHIGADEVLAGIDRDAEYLQRKIDRLKQVKDIQPGDRILDIGAAQGRFIIVGRRMGYDVLGVEPSETALKTSAELADRLGVEIPMREGAAESIPYPDNYFDVVHANSVMEHVLDLEKSLDEIYRVLKPGGLFWFNSASSMSPRQNEIRSFPLFGWYPLALKRKIMYWARDHKPALIGGTPFPAIYWFTDRSAARYLRNAGFGRVYDRWDLRLPSEGGARYQRMLKLVKANKLTKMVANVFLGGCSYAAIKEVENEE